MTTHGSRPVGIDSSCFWLKVDPSAWRRVSRSGDSDVTVIVADTLASFIGSTTSVLLPSVTATFVRSTVEKPDSSDFRVYEPGERLMNRKSPWEPVVVVRGAPIPLSVTVTPGSTPPVSSVTRP